jgi:hypothetical protein
MNLEKKKKKLSLSWKILLPKQGLSEMAQISSLLCYSSKAEAISLL